ncbi:MAG: VanW family protein [Lachnospiraceae bacterium]|nr:VanW family protein [Lachnospiraceae bacterium]
MKKQKTWPAFLVIGIMLALIGAYICITYMMVKPDADKICEGVYVDTVDLSGMTREQAESAIGEYVDKLSSRTLSVDVNGKQVTTTLSELEYTCNANDYIEEAMKVGKEGNLFSNYAEIKEVGSEHMVYQLEFSYSEKKLKKFVKKTCGKECTSAKNSNIKMKNGSLVYTDAREGVSIDTDTTIANIQTALKEQEDTDIVQAEAVVTVEEPMITKEVASRCQNKLGSFSTNFTASNVSRSRNVANAAKLINGSVIYPGETFSVHDTISPLTEENGYYTAASYSNGQVVDSIGGGVCQVSTTLYNAVLRAELEIVERSPHSMVVTYVKPSMDAAIAGDYKDFKFRNNTEVPIYIEGGTYTGTVYFNIYGEETRSPDRSVTFESEVIETIEPGADKVTIDKTKPASYMEVTQEAHTGYKAVLWKIVTENGETERTQINSSTYQAEPRYVIRGGAKATPKPTKEPDGKDKDKNKDKDKDKGGEKITKETPTPKPQATKPAATATPVPAATAEPVE